MSKLLHENGHTILVWEHNPDYLKLLKETQSNPALLPGIILSEDIAFCGDWHDVLSFRPNILILATPSQFLRMTLTGMHDALGDKANVFWGDPQLKAVVNLAKGIEEQTLSTMSQLIKDFVPCPAHHKVCCLSGPSHAEEVAKQVPTAVVIAAEDETMLEELQQVFSNRYFRVYRSTDLVGVEIGGAVKNIIAIAAGIIDGLGYGDNTKGALIARGIVEIQRLGLVMGARSDTFLGLSGIGDLVTTAISSHSRNRNVGYGIGKGRKLQEVLSDMSMVAEGVASTRSVYYLSEKVGIEMPITTQIFKVLYEDKDPLTAITDLMTRDLKSETPINVND